MTDERSLVDAECIQKTAQVVGHFACRIAIRRSVAPSVAAQVVGQHPICLLELRDDSVMPPGQVSAQTVDKHDLRPLPRLPVMKLQIVGFYLWHIGSGRLSVPTYS